MEVHVRDGLTANAAHIHTEIVPTRRSFGLAPRTCRRNQLEHGLLLQQSQRKEVGLVTTRHDENVTRADRKSIRERHRKFISGDDETFHQPVTQDALHCPA